jgi:hypothetical protein
MIEEKIDKLIVAIERLTETLQNMPSVDQMSSEGPATKEEEKLGQILDTLQQRVEESKPKKAKKEKPAPAPVAEEPAPAAAPVAEEPAPVAAPEITLSQIREAAQKALDNGKLDQVIAINKEYGLKRISDAATEQWAEILAKLDALNNG